MTFKQQPQIRVLSSGKVLNLARVLHDEKEVMAEHQDVGYYIPYNFSDVQELTPLSHDGVRIGIGDKVSTNVPNEGNKIIDWYEAHDGVIWLVTNDITNITKEDITDHTPLTEMKKEENTRDYVENTGNKELADLALGEDNDKPTIEKKQRTTTQWDSPDEKINKILEVLADAGLINLEDNQE